MNLRWVYSQDGRMIGGMLIFFTLLFSRYLFSTDQIIYNHDITYFYPHETIIRHSLEQNDFLLWNPYFGGGSPQLGKIQVGQLYPPAMLLRYLFPIVTMFNVDSMLHVYLAGLGIYLLLRSLGVTPVISTTSGIIFALSGSIMPRVLAGHISVLHSVAWIGWLLFAYRRLLHNRSWWNILLTVLFTSLVMLGGHLQFSALVLLAPISYFFFVYFPGKLRAKKWRDIVLGLIVSLLVGLITIGLLAVQIWPFLEWLGQTSRGSGEAIISYEFMIRNSLNWEHLLSQFFPFAWFELGTQTDLNLTGFSHFWEVSPFVGVTTIFLLGTSLLLRGNKEQRLLRYFGGLAIFSLFMSMGRINPIYQLVFDQLPYFRAPGRFLLLWTFSLAILFGISINGIHQKLSVPGRHIGFRKLYYLTLIISIFSTIFLWVWLVGGDDLVLLIKNQALLNHVDTEVLFQIIRQSLIMFTLAIVLITGLFRLGDRAGINAQRWQGIILIAIITEMIFFAAPLMKPKKVEVLFRPDHPYATLELDASEVRFPDYRLPPNYLLPTLAHVRNGEESIALISLLNYGQRGHNLLAAGYKASSEPLLDETDYQLVQQSENAFLYQHKSNLPRIYAAPSIKIVDTDDEALALVTAESFNAYDQAVVVIPQADRGSIPKLKPPSDNSEDAIYSAKFLTYGNNSFTAQIDVDRSVIVVFSEMFYPGWQAVLDGQATTIWKTNYAFRGIVVDEGSHLIEMFFRPRSYQIGFTITSITLVLVIFLSGWNGIILPKNGKRWVRSASGQ